METCKIGEPGNQGTMRPRDAGAAMLRGSPLEQNSHRSSYPLPARCRKVCADKRSWSNRVRT